ncbi:MAG: F0F1 ATP synthase subunit delta, partial [Muribaculaceae bacterium]|nr:F0F1 ATP synthase subunit delta [Muribaculaceae bacterium]
TEEVNPDLIGGFVIDVDSTRMDASLSNELEQLRQNLIRSN